MSISEYLSHLNTLYLTGNAREHSYRGDLQTLMSTLLPDILVTNEPYQEGFRVNELFGTSSVGVVTAREDITITFDKKYLEQIIEDFKTLGNDVVRLKYSIAKDTRDWKMSYAAADLKNSTGVFEKIACKPFDLRHTFYTGNTKGFYSYPRNEVMNHFIQRENWGLVVSKQAAQGFKHVFITNTICNLNLTGTAGKFGAGYTFPLYLYPETSEQQTTDGEQPTRTPNLDPSILSKMAKNLSLSFVPEKEVGGNVCMANSEEVRDDFRTTFAPIDVLDYIYAVLHSPNYREKYKEFLKIDFPRVPYPEDSEKFWQLVKLGGELRKLHLLESPLVEQYITGYPEDGDNVITRKITKNSPGYEPDSETHGKVWINDQQYFDKVPLVAWEFYIGGYQPAQKWLKDRKGRELSFEDILHYQRMIVALTETDRLIKEIDAVGVFDKEELAITNKLDN